MKWITGAKLRPASYKAPNAFAFASPPPSGVGDETNGKGFRMKILPVLVASGVAALAATTLVAGLTFEARNANATMRFTEQTGKPCMFCHTGSPPALNNQGKRFKANGNKL